MHFGEKKALKVTGINTPLYSMLFCLYNVLLSYPPYTPVFCTKYLWVKISKSSLINTAACSCKAFMEVDRNLLEHDVTPVHTVVTSTIGILGQWDNEKFLNL